MVDKVAYMIIMRNVNRMDFLINRVRVVCQEPRAPGTIHFQVRREPDLRGCSDRQGACPETR